jgi:hypothetical protein
VSTTKTESNAQLQKVIDDWPEDVPITEVELELFEQHMLDILTAVTQHG